MMMPMMVVIPVVVVMPMVVMPVMVMPLGELHALRRLVSRRGAIGFGRLDDADRVGDRIEEFGDGLRMKHALSFFGSNRRMSGEWRRGPEGGE